MMDGLNFRKKTSFVLFSHQALLRLILQLLRHATMIILKIFKKIFHKAFFSYSMVENISTRNATLLKF